MSFPRSESRQFLSGRLLCGLLCLLRLEVVHRRFDRILRQHAAVELHRWQVEMLGDVTAVHRQGT